MRCPFCSAEDSRVTETREMNGCEIRRRRECLSCSRRFTTRERCEEIVRFVVKNDGRREEFQVEKIRRGLQRACEKRPVASEKIEEIVTGIEKEISLLPGKEIGSRILGEKVMSALKSLDDVAYIRFASVYKKFQVAEEFAAEINNIIYEKEKK